MLFFNIIHCYCVPAPQANVEPGTVGAEERAVGLGRQLEGTQQAAGFQVEGVEGIVFPRDGVELLAAAIDGQAGHPDFLFGPFFA